MREGGGAVAARWQRGGGGGGGAVVQWRQWRRRRSGRAPNVGRRRAKEVAVAVAVSVCEWCVSGVPGERGANVRVDVTPHECCRE